MPKLTDTQLVVLSTAATRDDGAVLPLSKTLKANKGAIASSLKSLIRRGLIAELSATGDAVIWREAKDGVRFTLHITDLGLNAIGIDPSEAAANPAAAGPACPAKQRTTTKAVTTSPNRSVTKQTLLLDLLHRPNGASIDELSSALGWQPHSVRGAIAGTVRKKLGFPVTSEKIEPRGRVYRITTDRVAAQG